METSHYSIDIKDIIVIQNREQGTPLFKKA